jgi:hypothetical protein
MAAIAVETVALDAAASRRGPRADDIVRIVARQWAESAAW